ARVPESAAAPVGDRIVSSTAFPSRGRHPSYGSDWSTDACSSDLGRLVVLPADHVVRRVLLRHDAVRIVVRVPVPDAVSQPLRAGIVRVAQVPGYRATAPGPDILDRGADPPGDRVRLRRRRPVYDGLRQVD